MSMLPADAHRVLFQNEGPARNADGSLKQVMLNVAGKSYRCFCGCNVFHHPEQRQKDLYECNGCGSQFEAE